MANPNPYHDQVADSFELPESKGNSRRNSVESTSTTSLILERIHPGSRTTAGPSDAPPDKEEGNYSDEEDGEDPDLETGGFLPHQRPLEKSVRRSVYIIGSLLVGAWLLSLIIYLSRGHYKGQDVPHDPSATATAKAGKTITMDMIMGGSFRAQAKNIEWISGSNGEDGLMLVQGGNTGYLEVQDSRNTSDVRVLMQEETLRYGDQRVSVRKVWPSPDLKKVLVASEVQSNWRHSFTAIYWIYDIESGNVQPLVPKAEEARLALAVWSPKSNAIAFVRDNNLYIRRLPEQVVTQVTNDGGPDLFYGIPDWVYEEEVFSGNTALWWNDKGSYLAFLRTNESQVPDYPLQYFVSRPSGEQPESGLENYPELDYIKYPKAGAPNPVVDLQFFDIKKSEAFSVNIENDFTDSDRLITEVLWAGGSEGQNVLIRETNRESDLLRMVFIDASARTGKVVREQDVNAIDGGWFEVSEHTKYIPADKKNGRENDGYIDTVIHEGYDHLAYFTPVDNAEPILLTKGEWEVVDAPSAVDLKNNLVYFVATEQSPTERHVYSVKLDGTDMKPLTNTTEDGFYGVSFSTKAGYALLSYNGPGIPWQKLIGTPSGDPSFSMDIENNEDLASRVAKYEIPTSHFSTIEVDGYGLQVMEFRPPHFDKNRKYPVLFHVYGGPGSQLVQKTFDIHFEKYVAANLGYIVVTVDGRGTGFAGRKTRVAVRGNIGYWEAHDQIAAAKIWSAKEYVDKTRIAIWGWSYGGFMTLKTLEQDVGKTFSYGMAVAPVTDWRFYDSIYTERYMHTPQENPEGYTNATVRDVDALSQNVRFLVMHGVADDNVHFQNSLTLLDKLDLGGVENYDVHVFPDSDHGIYFHNANKMVYDRLSEWLVRAFNGEYLKLKDLRPISEVVTPEKRELMIDERMRNI